MASKTALNSSSAGDRPAAKLSRLRQRLRSAIEPSVPQARRGFMAALPRADVSVSSVSTWQGLRG